jgi:alkanesulfonate monooxygenase SsuD/methylene tetrahydromethanopterin reductase-like flavin-dependent oxidoreductase (luciferase family)
VGGDAGLTGHLEAIACFQFPRDDRSCYPRDGYTSGCMPWAPHRIVKACRPLAERPEAQRRRRAAPGGIGGDGRGAGFSVIAGTPDSIRTYMDEYVATGANYFVCSFQWGGLTHDQAMRSIDLFVEEIMPHYR